MALLPSTDPAKYSIQDINTFVGNVLQLALSVAGLVAVVYVLIGAFYYHTAYGSEEKANKGKSTLLWAIIGLVVIAAAKLIIYAIWHFITGQPLTFPI